MQRFLSFKHLHDRPGAVAAAEIDIKSERLGKEEEERKQEDVNRLVQKISKTYRGRGNKLLNFILISRKSTGNRKAE